MPRSSPEGRSEPYCQSPPIKGQIFAPIDTHGLGRKGGRERHHAKLPSFDQLEARLNVP